MELKEILEKLDRELIRETINKEKIKSVELSDKFFYLLLNKSNLFVDFNIWLMKIKIKTRIRESELININAYKFANFSNFLFSPKTQKDTFEPIVADWQEEYFEALHKKEVWKARMINVRYTYAFIVAMWQKSPLGDLLEYVRKFAS